MKRLSIYVALIMIAMAAQAQTIHWITFIDTTDDNVGHFDVTGRKVLYNRFINVINAALAEKGYNSDIQDFYGNRTTPENCKRAIETLRCRPEDIIVFYYIGHGGRSIADDDKAHPYPSMWLAQGDPRKMVPLEWVHNTLKDKNARLTATIGMCCNAKQNLPVLHAPSFGINYGNAYLSDNKLNAIQDMFLNHKGDFILSSASPSQKSYGATTPLGDMDLFTAQLVLEFDRQSAKGNMTWQSLFDDVKKAIHNISETKQTPMFANNIVSNKASRPTPERKAPARPAASGIDLSDSNVVGNLLMENFDFAIDASQKFEDRIGISDRLSPLFADDAVIKILGQDTETVTDKEPVKNFMGRIATSRILLKIVPTSYKWRGNKIVELNVKEYYKEK